MSAMVRFRVSFDRWISQEQREIKKAFLPFLRNVFYDRSPQYIEQDDEQVTNQWGRTSNIRHQKVHYFIDPKDIPTELVAKYIPGLSLDRVVSVEIKFCGCTAKALTTETPYADLIFHYEEVDIPKREFNPLDFTIFEEGEFLLARPDEGDPFANKFAEIKDKINPDLRITDMNKFFSNRLQWLREALISCEQAIEIMLEGIKISLGVRTGGEHPEHW